MKEREKIIVGGSEYWAELGQDSKGLYWACCTYRDCRVHGHGTKKEAIEIVKKALADLISISPN